MSHSRSILRMAKTALSEVTPNHDEIAAEAYQIYLREGSVEGRDLDHWLQAEINLRSRSNGNGNGNGNPNGNTAANGNGHAQAERDTQSITKEPSNAMASAASRNAQRRPSKR
jgi:hypothetical protein